MTRTISAIKIQKKNQNRVNIYLDGDFAFGLSKINAIWLKIGQQLSEKEIEKLLADDEVEVAYQRALKFLSFRARSLSEIEEKLKKIGYSESVVEVVCLRLLEKGYVDDHKFAENWVENRNTFRPRGHQVLRWELRAKKINEEIIESILEETDSNEALARLAAEKYARKINESDKETYFRKFVAFLGRRGFPYAISISIVREMWEANIEKNLKNLELENEVNNGV